MIFSQLMPCLQVLIMRHILHNVRRLLAASMGRRVDGAATASLPLETPSTLTDDVPADDMPAGAAIVEYQTACYTSFGQNCQSSQQLGSEARPLQAIDANGKDASGRGQPGPALGSPATLPVSPPVAPQSQTGSSSVATPLPPSPLPMLVPAVPQHFAHEAAPTITPETHPAAAVEVPPPASFAQSAGRDLGGIAGSDASMRVEGAAVPDTVPRGGPPVPGLRGDGTTVIAAMIPFPAPIDGEAGGRSTVAAVGPASLPYDTDAERGEKQACPATRKSSPGHTLRTCLATPCLRSLVPCY